MSRFFNNLKLVNKVLLMVGLLGSLSVLITVFALLNMRAIGRSYRDLLAVVSQLRRQTECIPPDPVVC